MSKNVTTMPVTAEALAEAGIAPIVPATRPCACGWSVRLSGDRTGDLAGRPKAHRDAAEYDAETDTTDITIPCDRQTASTFAPGHDARLKGLAITATLLGGDLTRGGLSAKPTDVLQAIAPNLVRFVTEAQAAAKAAAEAKAAKAAAKAETAKAA